LHANLMIVKKVIVWISKQNGLKTATFSASLKSEIW